MAEKKIIYLACPYSHPERAMRIYRFEKANEAAGKLISAGEIVFSPISHTHPIFETMADISFGWDFWHKFDLAFLEVSKKLIVVKIDGWKESAGVQAEIKIAEKLGIPIEYY